MFFDFRLLLFISPALILAFIASLMVKAAYAQARNLPARLTGYATARNILDRAGLYDVEIEQVPGEMSDHYDPRDKVVRLSPDVYHGHSLAAVGIAAHEVGHAIQDAQQYGPLVIRNAAVSTAGFGGNIGMLLVMLGLAFVVPLSKHRVSAPYVLITLGAAVLLFVAVRALRLSRDALMTWGRNPLVLYCAHLVLLGAFLVPDAAWWHREAPLWQAALQFLGYAGVLHLLARVLERQKVFVSL